MLDQILSGVTVSLGVQPWLVWAPAAVLAAIGLLLILWPGGAGERKPAAGAIVVRSQPGRGPGRLVAGLLVLGLAALWATMLRQPQVEIAADGLACRPWSRPIAWADMALVAHDRIGVTGRSIVRIALVRDQQHPRAGLLEEAARWLLAIARARSVVRSETAVCGLDHLAAAGPAAAGLIQVAWGRARFGDLPDPADAAAVEAWCVRNPRANCPQATRGAAQQCTAANPLRAEAMGCRYFRAAAPEAAAPRVVPGAPARPPVIQIPAPAPAPQQRPAAPPPAPRVQPTPPVSMPPVPPPLPPAAPQPAAPAQPPAPAPPVAAPPAPSAPAVPAGKPAPSPGGQAPAKVAR